MGGVATNTPSKKYSSPILSHTDKILPRPKAVMHVANATTCTSPRKHVGAVNSVKSSFINQMKSHLFRIAGVVIRLSRHARKVEPPCVSQAEVSGLCSSAVVFLDLKAMGANIANIAAWLAARPPLQHDQKQQRRDGDAKHVAAMWHRKATVNDCARAANFFASSPKQYRRLRKQNLDHNRPSTARFMYITSARV